MTFFIFYTILCLMHVSIVSHITFLRLCFFVTWSKGIFELGKKFRCGRCLVVLRFVFDCHLVITYVSLIIRLTRFTSTHSYKARLRWIWPFQLSLSSDMINVLLGWFATMTARKHAVAASPESPCKRAPAG